jgi:hypothetical protein
VNEYLFKLPEEYLKPTFFSVMAKKQETSKLYNILNTINNEIFISENIDKQIPTLSIGFFNYYNFYEKKRYLRFHV